MQPEDRIWPEVLEVIYSNAGAVIHKTRMSESEEWKESNSQLFCSMETVPKEEIRNAIVLVERAGLVTADREWWDGPPDHIFLMLTKRGFEVAHARELTEQRQETNQNLAFFTLILGFAAIIQSIAAALQLNDPGRQVGLLLLTLVLTLAIGFYQSEPLEWLKALGENLFG